MGDTQKAKEYFTKALEVNPKNELAKNGLDTLKKVPVTNFRKTLQAPKKAIRTVPNRL